MLIIVGQGLAGTLVALDAERRGQSFRIIDWGSGITASRAAAGIFNPLTGPRFSPDRQDWDQIVPFYQEIEKRIGANLLHLIPLIRPLKGAKVGPQAFPKSASGWRAELCPQNEPSVRIEGGGWLAIDTLLDLCRERWRNAGVIEERRFDQTEDGLATVIWCGGLSDLINPVWSSVPGVSGTWQAVRGDVLTVRIPEMSLTHGEIGENFLIPLGNGLFRWGATHERDVVDMDFRPEALEKLEKSLGERLRGVPYEVVDHRWGVRAASRNQLPLVIQHPLHAQWTLFNGFGGRGVATIPRWLSKLRY